jgi:hypothetical protein
VVVSVRVVVAVCVVEAVRVIVDVWVVIAVRVSVLNRVVFSVKVLIVVSVCVKVQLPWRVTVPDAVQALAGTVTVVVDIFGVAAIFPDAVIVVRGPGAVTVVTFPDAVMVVVVVTVLAEAAVQVLGHPEKTKGLLKLLLPMISMISSRKLRLQSTPATMVGVHVNWKKPSLVARQRRT